MLALTLASALLALSAATVNADDGGTVPRPTPPTVTSGTAWDAPAVDTGQVRVGPYDNIYTVKTYWCMYRDAHGGEVPDGWYWREVYKVYENGVYRYYYYGGWTFTRCA
jgi:hypothetical protein